LKQQPPALFPVPCSRLKPAETLSGIETAMPYISGAIQHCLKPAETLSGIETNVMPETHLEKGASNRLKPSQGLKRQQSVGQCLPTAFKISIEKVGKSHLNSRNWVD